MKKTAFINGKIYVSDGQFAQACLIEDGAFTHVGENADVKAAGAEIIDCEGRTVIPGLNDSHCHLFGVARSRAQAQLQGASSIEDVILRGRAYLDAHPGLKILTGRGWNPVHFGSGEARDLTRADLDLISREIPIAFSRACGHMTVCNTKALEMAGISADASAPKGGMIGRDESGALNGQFVDNAMGLLYERLPEEDGGQLEENLAEALRYAASRGLTSVQSNDPGGRISIADSYALLDGLRKKSALPVRYRGQNDFEAPEDFERYLKDEKRGLPCDDFLSTGPLKLFKDGSIGGRSALMRECYLDSPGNRGVSVRTDEELDRFCALADEYDEQVICHCIGDGAIESLLGRYEKVLRDGWNPLRHAIVHCQMMDADLVRHLAKDEILLLEQPIFLDSDMHALAKCVPEALARTSNCYRTLMRLGARQAFGTDSPVEDLNPFPCIYSAVTRRDMNGFPEEGYYPKERITVPQAIDCYTLGGAYAQFAENRKGRVQRGYLADLCVLDRDIFTCDPMEIKDIQPALTVMGGEITYRG